MFASANTAVENEGNSWRQFLMWLARKVDVRTGAIVDVDPGRKQHQGKAREEEASASDKSTEPPACQVAEVAAQLVRLRP